MQAWIIRHVERLQERIAATDCSIATALEVEMREYDALTLFKLRDAAIDLQRIVELTLGERGSIDRDVHPCDCRRFVYQPGRLTCGKCGGGHFENDAFRLNPTIQAQRDADKKGRA